MKKNLFKLTATICYFTLLSSPALFAQNVAPFWSTTGNSNAGTTPKLGTTNSAPLRFFTNNTERLHIDASGNVGIGTSTPINILTVKLNGSTPSSSWLGGGSSLPVFIGFAEEKTTGFNLATAANASGYRPVLNTRRSRGTLASPAIVQNNDYLASFVSSGYDGSVFQNPASIDFYVDGIPSAGNVPGRISFVTGSNAANRVERLKVSSTGDFAFNNNQVTIVQSTGYVGIGTNLPLSQLHVAGSGRFTKGLAIDSGGITAAAGNTYGTGISGTGFYGVSGTGTYGVSGQGQVGLYGVGGPTGVIGFGNTYGVYGNGKQYGLYGISDYGVGSYGLSNLTAGVGVRGEAPGALAVGVVGVGGIYGVSGYTTLSQGIGLHGQATSANGTGVAGYGGAVGVFGQSTGANGTGILGFGSVIGIKGVSTLTSGNGVMGEGDGANSFGVVGAAINVGVYGEGRLALLGYSTASAGRAVDGEVTQANAIGVYGYTSAPSTLIALTYAGFFTGNVGTTGGYWSVSDRRLKQNINDVTNAMDIIKKLHPKSYNFRQDGNYKLMNLPPGNHYGLIAQDLEQVLPNLVKDTRFDTRMTVHPKKQEEDQASTQPVDTSSEVIQYKTINYIPLIPIIIEGMKEQQIDIEKLQEKASEVDALKQEVAELRQMVLELKGNANGTVTLTGAYLEQNNPNPVAGSTIIRYYVPNTASSIQLTITDVKGQLIKTLTPVTGAGQINLDTRALAAGTYNYSLWVEGKQVDTKRMVIGK